MRGGGGVLGPVRGEGNRNGRNRFIDMIYSNIPKGDDIIISQRYQKKRMKKREEGDEGEGDRGSRERYMARRCPVKASHK